MHLPGSKCQNWLVRRRCEWTWTRRVYEVCIDFFLFVRGVQPISTRCYPILQLFLVFLFKIIFPHFQYPAKLQKMIFSPISTKFKFTKNGYCFQIEEQFLNQNRKLLQSSVSNNNKNCKIYIKKGKLGRFAPQFTFFHVFFKFLFCTYKLL